MLYAKGKKTQKNEVTLWALQKMKISEVLKTDHWRRSNIEASESKDIFFHFRKSIKTAFKKYQQSFNTKLHYHSHKKEEPSQNHKLMDKDETTFT